MDNNIKKYLYDVKVSIDSIYEYLGANANFELYCNNKVLRRAIEREFEIIGEALNSINKIKPDLNITNIRRIIDFRNYLIHGYTDISNKVVWSIIETNLPLLKKEINEYYN